VTLTRRYDTWGNPLQGSEIAGYAFTGREWDPESGLYYYRARYYDPKIGRFLSEDPIPIALRTHEEVNPYAYVMNRPINAVDPSGLSARSYADCLSNCLYQTLTQNRQTFGCNLTRSVVGGAIGGAATCVIIVAVEPELLPALPGCLVIAVPSTIGVAALWSFNIYTWQNVGSTLGCLIFCAGSL
jgi:RHS repeat-associated protein